MDITVGARVLACLGLLALGGVACDLDPGDDLDELADEDDPLLKSRGYVNNPVLVPFVGPFDMCADRPARDSMEEAFGVDLNNARWLAFFSANEYAHYARFAPVLQAMGFGSAGEGDAWVEAGRELVRKRHDPEIPIGIAAGEEQALLQTVVPGKKIQFFTAGRFSKDGNEFIDGSAQMMWAEHPAKKLVVISFRGTETDKGADFKVDLNVFFSSFTSVEGAKLGKVHAGFKGSFASVQQLLHDKLAAEAGRGLHIWITGHSLGGALAELAATEVVAAARADRSATPTVFEGIYTFGQPRTSNDDFRFNWENLLWELYPTRHVSLMRFRHADDLVSRIPGTALGFSHAGHLFYMAADGTLTYQDLDPELGGTKAAVSAMADHSIDGHYYRRIAAHATDPQFKAWVKRCP